MKKIEKYRSLEKHLILILNRSSLKEHFQMGYNDIIPTKQYDQRNLVCIGFVGRLKSNKVKNIDIIKKNP